MVKRSVAATSDSVYVDQHRDKLRRLVHGSLAVHSGVGLQSMPDELLLRILSFLALEDLVTAQSVSHRISSLAKDSQLWKTLYHERFVYRRFGKSIKHVSRTRRPTQRQQLQMGSSSNRTYLQMDWKSKYRLRHKWQNGTCSFREITLASEALPQTFLCLRGSIAITADSECGLRAWKISRQEQSLIAAATLGGIHDVNPSSLSVEADTIDQDTFNVAIGFATGEIGLFRFNLDSQIFIRLQKFDCFEKQTVSSVSQANRKYLLAMSECQVISLFEIDWTDTKRESPPLLSSLKSRSDWKPVSVSLRSTSVCITASIIYAYPRFVSGWCVGLQELRWSPETHQLLSTRLATSDDAISKPKLASRVEYLPPTITKPTSLCYTHPYLLATHPDNTLSLYMVRSTIDELSISPGMRLWGHTSEISAANIGDRGKAVTVANGGDVRVWEFEEGLTSALARKATPGPLVSVRLHPKSVQSLSSDGNEVAQSTSVDFDEERLVILKNRGTNAQALFVYDFT